MILFREFLTILEIHGLIIFQNYNKLDKKWL